MKKLSALLFSLIPFLSFAHPGHGENEGYTLTHYLVEPVHLITGLVVGMALYIYFNHSVRKSKKA